MENCMDRYLGQMLDNRYEILEIIGSGGMAVVYKALCHRLNRYVAVKVLKDEFADNTEFREHFKAESQAVAMLSHPNIVSVYDYSRDPNCQYIIMELLDGITLKQYMQKKGALSWKEALHFTAQIARALSHAHSKGIVHRDIKPQNIMVVKDGTVKVADFGIAYLQNESVTDPAETMGSIHYISPEQARGEPVDARSDIYSLGIVMYEMLTGKLPYEGDTIEGIAVQHMGGLLIPPSELNPEIPPSLQDICLKAMVPELHARYQSAEQLLLDVEAFRKSQALLGLAPLRAEKHSSRKNAALVAASPKKQPIIAQKRESYSRRRERNRTVSILSGIAMLGFFMIALVTFLWNFWLSDIFSDTERVEVPDFVGQNSNDIINEDDYKGSFNFHIVYTIDPEAPEGQVLSQKPEAGRSVAMGNGGVNIELRVSTGVLMTEIPDRVNYEFMEAKLSLEQLGFIVEKEVVQSDTITVGYVVGTVPEAGGQAPAGSTVIVKVSGGPELTQVIMPSLVGKGRNDALTKLTAMNLELGSVSEVEDNSVAGTIIWQSIEAGESVAERTVVYLKVSKGPRPTPTPEPSPEELPTPPSEPTPPPSTEIVGGV